MQASNLAPRSVNQAMSKIGMRFRLDASGTPAASHHGRADAQSQASGSWSSCVDLSYSSSVFKQGIKEARSTAHGKPKKRLGSWSAKKIAGSKKIPTKVKHQIADRGIASVLRLRAQGRPLDPAVLALDVVDQAFAKQGRNGLKGLVSGTCVAKVWAPMVTVTMSSSGVVRRLDLRDREGVERRLRRAAVPRSARLRDVDRRAELRAPSPCRHAPSATP